MRKTILAICVLLFVVTSTYAQKVKTVMGDAWNGVVESADEATREIKIVNPNKKTETFVGVLKDGYKVKLKDGASRELQLSELKPGQRVRLFYKSENRDVAGQRTKVNLIRQVQFLGHDNYSRLREMLKVEPLFPVAEAKSRELPPTDPFKLHLALQPQNLDKGVIEWVDQWNKEMSAKHGRIEIVDDIAEADASLAAIWGKDDSFIILPALVGYGNSELRDVGFGTGYLTIKDDKGVHVLWEGMIGLDVKEPERTAPGLGRVLEKKLKARKK